METAKCCFKIGKYLLEGRDYKNSIVRLASQSLKEGQLVDIIFAVSIIYLDGPAYENLTLSEMIYTIQQNCIMADNMDEETKRKCITDYMIWRDHMLPEKIEESYQNGKPVLEPEMEELLAPEQ